MLVVVEILRQELVVIEILRQVLVVVESLHQEEVGNYPFLEEEDPVLEEEDPVLEEEGQNLSRASFLHLLVEADLSGLEVVEQILGLVSFEVVQLLAELDIVRGCGPRIRSW